MAGILSVFSLLAFILALYSVYRYTKNGIVLKKGILVSALFLALSPIGMFFALIIIDQEYLPGALILLSIMFLFILFYVFTHLFFLSIFLRGRRKGKYGEIQERLKSYFGWINSKKLK